MLDSLKSQIWLVSKYSRVAIVCAVLNNFTVIAGEVMSVHYFISILFAFLTVTATGYFLHARFTFDAHFSGQALIRFYTGNIASLLASMALMVLLCDGVGLSPSIAMPIATVLMFVCNYLIARWAI